MSSPTDKVPYIICDINMCHMTCFFGYACVACNAIQPNEPYMFCHSACIISASNATNAFNKTSFFIRAKELCVSQGGHTGLPVHNSPYGLC